MLVGYSAASRVLEDGLFDGVEKFDKVSYSCQDMDQVALFSSTGLFLHSLHATFHLETISGAFVRV